MSTQKVQILNSCLESNVQEVRIPEGDKPFHTFFRHNQNFSTLFLDVKERGQSMPVPFKGSHKNSLNFEREAKIDLFEDQKISNHQISSSVLVVSLFSLCYS